MTERGREAYPKAGAGNRGEIPGDALATIGYVSWLPLIGSTSVVPWELEVQDQMTSKIPLQRNQSLAMHI